MAENFECLYHGEMFPRRGDSSSAPRWTSDVNFQQITDETVNNKTSGNHPNKRLNLSVMEGSKCGVKVLLKNDDLWRVFRENQTEMIITRAGRRMFPVAEFNIYGLEPEAYYSFMIQIISADNHRYRYDITTNKWIVSGEASYPEIENNTYMHPHGSALGKVWMQEGAKFDKVKLSNHYKQFSDFIILSSLQKYRIQVVLTKISAPSCERWLFDFPETMFMAVTCYQNPSITRLKIDFNPFAKAFRHGKRPIKRLETEKRKEKLSSQKSSKEKSLFLSSPPPVTRLQPPPLEHFPEDQQKGVPTPPPPPMPPMNLYCPSLPPRDIYQEEIAMQRYMPLVNDPLLWEPQHAMTSHRTCLPPISTSFRFDAPPPIYKPEPQTYFPGWHHDLHAELCNNMNLCSNGHYGNAWMTGGFLDDAPLRHYGYDSRLT